MSHRDAFTAIADPTRREILDLLRTQGTLVAGEIAAHFETASRPGISRHLRVLKQCGVVRARRDGKRQNYTLRTKPLDDLHSGWLANFAEKQTSSLKTLREIAEADPAKSSRD